MAGDPAALLCPRCETPLSNAIGGIADGCRSCGLIWFSGGADWLSALGPEDLGPSPWRCPGCATPMTERGYVGCPTARVDTCNRHGVALTEETLRALRVALSQDADGTNRGLMRDDRLAVVADGLTVLDFLSSLIGWAH